MLGGARPLKGANDETGSGKNSTDGKKVAVTAGG